MSSKTKKNIVSFIVVMIMFIVITIPVLAASSKYDFSMEYREVNGKKNGEYHTLSAGKKATIRGYTEVYASKPGALGPYDIHYTLYRDRSGFDPEYGTVNGGINRSFSGTFNKTIDTTSDKYYLLIWKTNEDGHSVMGEGTLSN